MPPSPTGKSTKPVLRYLGGKNRLAPWIIAHFPRHDIYLEPFFGGGSVFFAKPPAPRGETINDLDGEIINLFTVLRSPEQADALIRAVALTAYSKAEQRIAFQPCDDPVERARRLVVRSYMTHGTMGTKLDQARGFRVDGISGKTTVARYWLDMPETLAFAADRIRLATIQQKDAVDLIAEFDDPKCLIYADPPYVPSTRSTKRDGNGDAYHAYSHEMSDADHVRLLESLIASRSMVVLSGYRCDLYDRMLQTWRRADRKRMAYRQVEKVESIWINPQASAALQAGPLFEGGRK